MTLTPEIIASLAFTAVAVASAIVIRRRRKKALAAAARAEQLPAPVLAEKPAPNPEMISRLRASLLDLQRQLDGEPFRTNETNARTKVLILHRCGMSLAEIAEHLSLPQFEVDLIVQVAAQTDSATAIQIVRP